MNGLSSHDVKAIDGHESKINNGFILEIFIITINFIYHEN